VTYPKGSSSSVFTFAVSPSLTKRDVQSWPDIQGVSISVSGNANIEPVVTFGGRYGGSGNPIYDANHWTIVHTMPAGFKGVPELIIKFK
jgi:hypothetical protein